MAPFHLIDELHVQLRIPRDLPSWEVSRIRRVLGSRSFPRDVLKVIRDLFASQKALTAVHVRLAR